MTRLTTILLMLICLPPCVKGGTQTAIFDPGFRTLKVQLQDAFMAPPVMRLGSADRLVFSFDQMGDAHSYLRFRIVPCNAFWEEENILESEYLEGFNEAPVEDYAYSSGGFRHYVNYRIPLCETGMVPTVAGNYLLQVYDEDDPDATLLQARFGVLDPKVSYTEATADAHTPNGNNESWQQVQFRLNPGTLQLRDPLAELITTVEQDGLPIPGGAISPQRVDGNALVYNHRPELTRPAGNEWRRFETSRIQGPTGMHVDSVRYFDDGYTAYLTPDLPRTDTPYYLDRTQHGRFMVHEYYGTDPDLSADYVNTVFTLYAPWLPRDAVVRLDGEFVRSLSPQERTLTRQGDIFTITLPLKQGLYNYRYTLLTPGGEDPSPIEGDKYETENEFTVKTYYRPPLSRHDFLVGTATIITSP